MGKTIITIKVRQLWDLKDVMKLVNEIKGENPYTEFQFHIKVFHGRDKSKRLTVINHGLSERGCDNLIKEYDQMRKTVLNGSGE